MALIELLAATELILFSCSWAKRRGARKRQALLGSSSVDSLHLPIIDAYLRRNTSGASSLQVCVSSQVARFFRRAVHTRSFEYLLLHGIRSALKRRSKSRISSWRISL
jgi:hypothetical protein